MGCKSPLEGMHEKFGAFERENLFPADLANNDDGQSSHAEVATAKEDDHATIRKGFVLRVDNTEKRRKRSWESGTKSENSGNLAFLFAVA